VAVASTDATGMLDFHKIAVTPGTSGDAYDAGARGMDGGHWWARQVNARVPSMNSLDRIAAPPEGR